ncbi:HNH endonuclease [Candidatus Thiomargarita nelsonii]|uniref:HNH endonuclease n=1 Tax=Candidatus Thiomargarita nelsonii TaxID=1003181 RepID=A0A0A6PFE8_9GAMM|nr:HNH endonuclease [Candidatus Thiomargarita nelsonii]
MQRVFVLDLEKKPLMPCHPARARELLNKGRAAVYKRYPFTLILKDKIGGDVQPVELKFDPGSKTTGIALVGHFERGLEIVFGANLNHRGQKIKKDLESRRANRRGRRNRKTRYRPARFNNRRRTEGWLPPSLMSRVFNVETWAKRLQGLIPITSIAVETVRFDTQKMQNPEVSDVEYQQGELAGYEVREYLLEKWGRQCAYCGAEKVPLEIEHIQPKSKGGSNRVFNLTIACRKCNQKKGNRSIEDFLKRKPTVLKRIKAQTKKSLKDTAAVNVTRYAIGNALKQFGLPVTFWSGGRTKFNRTQQKYPKDHWIDAACVGETGEHVLIPKTLKPLSVTAVGHGSRQMCRVDQYGFPRTTAKKQKVVKGFQTGDIVKAVVTRGKKIGTYIGRVAVRASGSFNISTKNGTTQGISWKYCQRIQAVDGYSYLTEDRQFLH